MELQAVVVFSLKVVFSIAAFLGISYFGTFFDRRIAGVLLTFPILNVIGLLSVINPERTAATICVIVVWNAVLFTLVLTWLLYRRSQTNGNVWYRFVGWVVLWFIGAFFITRYFDDYAPTPLWMFVVTCGLRAACIAFWWSEGASAGAKLSLIDWGNHKAQIRTFFSDTTLWLRLGLFTVVVIVIQISAIYSPDPKWTGMASACPLPGIFALAILSVNLSEEELKKLRDTVFFGPVLVIPFNLLFAQVPPSLPNWWLSALLAGLSLGAVFWLVSAVLVATAIPLLSNSVERRRSVKRNA